MQLKSKFTAEPGDVVVVHGHSTGDPERTGVILEVLGSQRSRALPRPLGRGARIALLARLDATVRPGTRRKRRATSPEPASVVIDEPVETGGAEAEPALLAPGDTLLRRPLGEGLVPTVMLAFVSSGPRRVLSSSPPHDLGGPTGYATSSLADGRPAGITSAPQAASRRACSSRSRESRSSADGSSCRLGREAAPAYTRPVIASRESADAGSVAAPMAPGPPAARSFG